MTVAKKASVRAMKAHAVGPPAAGLLHSPLDSYNETRGAGPAVRALGHGESGNESVAQSIRPPFGQR